MISNVPETSLILASRGLVVRHLIKYPKHYFMQHGTMLQYFHWYISCDGILWPQIKDEASQLKELGFSTIWFPPAFKGANGGYSVGMILMICMILENSIRKILYEQNMAPNKNI